ncbi:MAG: hypothetical protein J6W37_00140 [Bacteroidales bacterium]|nr:hypothetical protein [Bacteroidales bacterium]
MAAAALYAINEPCSKMLLTEVPPVFMAGRLYLGAGIGVGLLLLFHHKNDFDFIIS